MAYHISQIMHFRELGGMQSRDGRHIRNEMIFRCGQLSAMTEEDNDTLTRLGISMVFDLRTLQEQKERPDIPGTYRFFSAPANWVRPQRPDGKPLPEDDFSFFAHANEALYHFARFHFSLDYAYIPFNHPCIETVLKGLDSGKPFLFHCAGGKDRTGVVAMIVAAALGCGYEECKQNYMLHNVIAFPEFRRAYEGWRKGGASEWGIEYIKITSEAHEELFDTAWYSVLSRYDSFDEYFQLEYGVSQERLGKWRDAYLEK